MKKAIAVLLFGLLSVAPAAADERNPEIPHHHQGQFPKPEHYQSPPAPPSPGQEVRQYAIDEPGKRQKNFGVLFVDDNETFMQLLTDRFEYRTYKDEDILLWDGDAWIGGDYDKLYLESEGEWNMNGTLESASVEAFWNHAIRPFWDTQLGLRHDFKPEESRSFLAAGVQGMAPYTFEVDATAYLSQDGDASAVLEVERDWYFSQRIAVQPRFETQIAAQDVPEYDIGSGVTGFELGLRARYEFTRKFAPYVGVEWEQNTGETRDMLQDKGMDTSKTFFVAGVKLWF